MSKKKPKKVKSFPNLDNNPYAVPLLAQGHHTDIREVCLTVDYVMLNKGGTIYHTETTDDTISVFDYGKDVQKAFCRLVGIDEADLKAYAERALAVERLAEAKRLLQEHGYEVMEPVK